MDTNNIKLLLLAAISGIALIGSAAIAMDKEDTTKMTTKDQEKTDMSTDHLTPLQKKVTMEGGTEAPFKNEYWDYHEEGIYVDVINGTALFSSTDKFDSGTGWPSFSRPISEHMIDERSDTKFGMSRTEIKSDTSNAHLGHVFNDGPVEAGGLRYCINSAALRFVPKSALKKEGYSEYLKLFKTE